MFDPGDPLTWLESRPREPRPFVGAAPAIHALEPEQEQSLLSRIGSGALSGLGYAGGVLEKLTGGRALRGALGGQPRELLSIIPGSDVFGITDPEQRVSGKKLLGYGEGDTGWGPTLAGMGVELLTDPAMYLGGLGGKAFTEAGKVASKVGVLPATARGRVGQTLGEALRATPAARPAAEIAAGGAAKLAPLEAEHMAGVFGVGLPIPGAPTIPVATGATGEALLTGLGKVGSGLDWAARQVPVAGHLYAGAAKGLEAASRYIPAWLDPAVMGFTDRQAQEAARKASAARETLLSGAKEKAVEYGRTLKAAGAGQEGASLRQALEGVPITAPGGPQTLAAEQATASGMAADYAAMRQRLLDAGVDIKEWADPYAKYGARQAAPPAYAGAGFERQTRPLFPSDPKLRAAREEILTQIPGGTEAINQMFVDPLVHQGSLQQAAQHIAATYLPAGGSPIANHAERLADFARSLPAEFAAGGAGAPRFYGYHPVQDYLKYHERSSKVLAAAEAIHDYMARAAVELPPGVAAARGQKGVLQALEDVGLKANAPTGGARDTFLRKLNEWRAGNNLPALGPQDLARVAVPEQVLGQITRMQKGFTNPESLTPIMKVFDQATQLFKAGQTSLWPAFHVRNWVSGMWNNYVRGAFEPGLDPVSGFAKPIFDAKRLLNGEVIRDANKIPEFQSLGLTAQEATQQLGKEMFAQGIELHAPNIGSQAAGPGGRQQARTLNELLAGVPGEVPHTFTGAFGQAVPTTRAGFNPLSPEEFAPFQAGREIGNVVEGVNRGSLYIALRRQGYTAEQAGQAVKQMHFEYGREAMTDVEAKVLKRLVPFWTYSRHNLPLTLEQLATSPGGPTAVSARVAHSLSQEQPFVPPGLQGGLAVPVGETPEGKTRYISGLGLPQEQAFEFARGGPTPGMSSALAALAQLNPLIKGPLEYATGRQFFSGRPLESVKGPTGNTLLDEIIANSPASRLARTAANVGRLASAEEPAGAVAGLGTGIGLTDVDLARAKFLAERQYEETLLRGHPEVRSFQNFYLPPGAENIDPEALLLLRLQASLNAKAKAAAQQRRMAGG